MFLGKKDAARLRSASGSAGSGGTFGQAARAARQVWAWAHRAGDQVSRAGRQPSCHPASQARTGGARGHSFAGSPAARGPGRLSQSDSRRQARGGDRVEPKPGITCPTPTSVEHADIQVKNYSINSRERYVCNSGFKRKAGTSSLTQCVFNETAKVAHWTTPNLKCISAYQYNPRVVTAAVSTAVAVLFGVCLVSLLVRCLRSRQAHQTPGVEMESMESAPMTTGAGARGEDTEIHPHGSGGSGDAEARRGRSEGPALLQPERT
ncbi:interleukin-15 receptor subunit alpha isoform X6 [Moschus berezovskii]|uniref:interleukin-15 receptor subunit alpha isoform X6 n=1 Tax=Moschus berezovskii TaxID=68408 RepID=UPI0024438FD4|nr:interleukin-15 receptor subunit alpha isoform X6 [Moschus berezovskii]